MKFDFTVYERQRCRLYRTEIPAVTIGKGVWYFNQPASEMITKLKHDVPRVKLAFNQEYMCVGFDFGVTGFYLNHMRRNRKSGFQVTVHTFIKDFPALCNVPSGSRFTLQPLDDVFFINLRNPI